MPSGIYIAYTGASSAQAQLDVIANNVANVSTTGYRRDETLFDTVLGAAMPFSRAASAEIDLSPGTHQMTKNRLNAAIDGEGFFAVQDADGNEFFTRRGDFRIDGEGRLIIPNGLTVLGQSGTLTVPRGSQAELRGDGTLTTQSGPVGRLRMVRFAEPAELRKAGESLIAAGPGAGMEDIEHPRIAVGFVEGSNVNLAAEMVALIQAMRSFEASVKSIRVNDGLTQELIQVQR